MAELSAKPLPNATASESVNALASANALPAPKLIDSAAVNASE